MARILSQTLIQGHPSHLLSASRSALLPLSAARLVNLRGRSHRSERDLEAAESGEGEVEVEVIGVRRLEDAIHSIIIRRSAPDWLPFIPGSSYWVPPRKQAHRVAELIEKLANPLTDEETLSVMTNRGWPSSSHFLEGTSPRHVKRRPKKATAQSDDEE